MQHSIVKRKKLEAKNNSSSSQLLLWPLAIFLTAFILRLLYFFEIKNNPLFFTLNADAHLYHDLAYQMIVSKDFIGKEPFIINPGYPYLLSLVYLIFGFQIKIVAIIQFLVGAISASLNYIIALKISNNKLIAILTGIGSAIYSIFIFYEGFLLSFVWINFFNLLAILCLIRVKEKSSALWAWIAGIMIGLSALFRPNVVLLVPLLFFWFKFQIQSFLKNYFSLLLGIFIIVLPVTVKNYIVLREPVISSFSMGISFFIGNNPQSDGTDRAIFELGNSARSPRYMLKYFKDKCEQIVGRKVTYLEMDKFWLKNGLSFILGNPTLALKNFGRKILLTLNFYEPPNNYPLHILKKFSKVLTICPDSKFIIVLSFFSIVFLPSLYKIPGYALLSIFFWVQLLTILTFFLLGEYRAPMLPILIIYAATTINWAAENFKNKNYKYLFLFGLFSLGMFKIGNLPLYHKSAGDYYWQGIIYKQTGDIKNALDSFQHAIELDPTFVLCYNQIGVYFFESGDYEKAKIWFTKSLEITPAPDTYNNLGAAYFNLKNFTLAEKNYLEAIKIDPGRAEHWDGLAQAKFMMGKYTEAHEAWIKAMHFETDPKHKKVIESNLEAISKSKN